MTLEIVDVLGFISRNPSVIPHMLIMATCSALGQLFIFKTIKHYGPLVFATIQTVRQLLSVVLSILYFGHPINRMEAKKTKKQNKNSPFSTLGTRSTGWRQNDKTQKQDTQKQTLKKCQHSRELQPSFVTRSSHPVSSHAPVVTRASRHAPSCPCIAAMRSSFKPSRHASLFQSLTRF